MDTATERMIQEVGRHAAAEAMRAVVRIIDTLPPGSTIKGAAMAVAMVILQHKIDGMLDMDDGGPAAQAFRDIFEVVRKAYNDGAKELLEALRHAHGEAAMEAVAKRFGVNPVDIGPLR